MLGLGTALALLGLVAALVLVLTRPALAAHPSGPRPVRYHVLMPGETLWAVATELAPGADPRETVAEIVELNSLSGAVVRAGTRLALPPAG